jgi:Domain of unknown function (DUF6429)
MEIDTDKIDNAVLALLYLTLHENVRAWKGHDWDVLDRLYRKGMICDPVGKTRSVVLTDEGLAASERLFKELFGKPGTWEGAGPPAATRLWLRLPTVIGSSRAEALRGD